MILAFDVGNTNIVLGTIKDGDIIDFVRMRTDPTATSAEYAVKIIAMLKLMKRELNEFDGAIISTVVPQLGATLKEAIKTVTGCDAIIVSHKIDVGLKIDIDEPGSVAGDLLIAGVAAKEYYGYPAIILDLGTATTIMVVNREGAFGGGAIVPGIFLGLNALANGTALLPEISISAPDHCIGTNTVDCMRSGAVFGNAALIDGMIDRMEDEIGQPCKLIATGGLASSIVKYCRHDIVCDDNLLLKGLWAIYKRNK